jgi:hypothetical protein
MGAPASPLPWLVVSSSRFCPIGKLGALALLSSSIFLQQLDFVGAILQRKKILEPEHHYKNTKNFKMVRKKYQSMSTNMKTVRPTFYKNKILPI